jgi:hypothetical protein
MLEGSGEEIGALLDEERKSSRDELAAEVRRLWTVMSELQTTIRDLHRIQRGKVLEAVPVEERRVN